MHYKISDNDEKALRRIKKIGIREIWLYQSGPYISNVTFQLVDATYINFEPQEKHVEERFEVFIIASNNTRLYIEPVRRLDDARFASIKSISVISKCEWEVPTSDADKEFLQGDPIGSTTVYEGLEENVPKDALRSQLFDAGIRIDFEEGCPFYIVTGNPFELIISDSLSRTAIDDSIYESRIEY